MKANNALYLGNMYLWCILKVNRKKFIIKKWNLYWKVIEISDALQQNRDQVAQAKFEIWAVEVGIGVNKAVLSRSHTFAFIVILDLTPYLLRWYVQSTQGSLFPSPMN